MPYVWKNAEVFLTCRSVKIFYAYKDELSDVPLDFWYSTCGSEPSGSGYEFDVRDLPGYEGKSDFGDRTEHRRVIKSAIVAGLPRADLPFAENYSG